MSRATALEQRGPVAPAHFGGAVRTTNLDLLLATAVALGLPFLSAWLLRVMGGATLSLIVYYLVCGVLLVRWRKGTLDYRWPARWPWPLFGLSLLGPLLLTAINWASMPRLAAPALGVLLTALVWAPLNAAYEQLSWLYVLDAWRNRWPTGWRRWLGLIVGVTLMVALIGLIHVIFWIEFLPTTEPTRWSGLSLPVNFAMSAAFALLYYRSRSLWPTFVLHLLIDLQLVLVPRYSILPDL